MKGLSRAWLGLLLVTILGMVGSLPASGVPLSRDCRDGVGARMPVLLVHGFNSGPDTWTDKTRETIGVDKASTCVAVFDYSLWSTHWVTDERIGNALAGEVLALANASQRAGGPGKVVLVAHSMGGLAVRCAADQACSEVDGVSERIRALITFGTPNQGTYLKGYGRSHVANLAAPFVGTLCSGTGNALSLLSGACGGGRALTTSDAAKAFTPGSAQLDDLPRLPESVPVLAVAGSIKLRTSFWGSPPIRIGDVGDLIVSEDSALAASRTTDSIGGQKVIDCGEVDVHLLPRSVALSQAGMRCWHGTETNDDAFLRQVTLTLRHIKESAAPAPVVITATSIGGVRLGTGAGEAERLLRAVLGQPDRAVDGGCDLITPREHARYLTWGPLTITLSDFAPSSGPVVVVPKALQSWSLHAGRSRVKLILPHGIEIGMSSVEVRKRTENLRIEQDMDMNVVLAHSDGVKYIFDRVAEPATLRYISLGGTMCE